MITQPVSRHLAVADLQRSLGFYRDILGFSVNGQAATSGPARIDFEVGDDALDSTLMERRPRGHAILFFETDDVEKERETIVARGGKPSEVEKANWIKVKAFEIRDPDGHVLWFAQSFAGPDTGKNPGQLHQALPAFPLSDLKAGIAYYQNVLGFGINYADDNIGVMFRDLVTILLIPRSPKHTGIGTSEFYIRDADELHAELTGRGADLDGSPVSHPWGIRDFTARDLEGNTLIFGETFE